jgi:effector-binding domain-containing protein
MRRLGELNEHPAGPPFAIYYDLEMDGMDVEAGFPVASQLEGHGEVRAGTLPGGTFCTGSHVGSYEQLATTWEAINTFAAEQGYERAGPSIEFYLNSPEEVPVEELQTIVALPVRASDQ